MTDERSQHTPDLDEHDVALLERIETDFDMSLGELTVGLALSKSTVHYRLRKLREQNVIESLTVDINPSVLGLSMAMIKEMMVNHEIGSRLPRSLRRCATTSLGIPSDGSDGSARYRPQIVGDYYGQVNSSTNYALVYLGKVGGGVLGGVLAAWLITVAGWG
ncbi:MAG TPA: winged helix-turn-helix transcriptional regulator [Halococcus sp.]|nr:winged helix-turn-helix transcriptional regulator [Halococcus sp.]